MISSARAANVSTTKGFVSTRMPGSNWPLLMMAFRLDAEGGKLQMTAGGDQLALEADRLARAQHVARELRPSVGLIRDHLAQLLADNMGDAGMQLVGCIGLAMDIVGERTMRPVEKFDDAEACVDGVEQGAVALLALGERRLGLSAQCRPRGHGSFQPGVLDL